MGQINLLNPSFDKGGKQAFQSSNNIYPGGKDSELVCTNSILYKIRYAHHINICIKGEKKLLPC